MNDFPLGLMIGALTGFVAGSIATYVVYGWGVTSLLRGLASDTRRLLERTSAPPERH